MNLTKRIVLLPFIFFIFTGCDEQDHKEKGRILDIVNLGDPFRSVPSHAYSTSVSMLTRAFAGPGTRDLLPFIKYDVSIHRFTYQTTYKGNAITASGAVTIPIGATSPRILVFHHGTMFHDGDTPSGFTKLSTWGMEIFSAAGYIAFIPDYIGYGSSNDIIHPYHLYEPTVNASIDMIAQGKVFLKSAAVNFLDDGVLLCGFSEGGYAAFAVQKEIESHPELNVTVKASAPGAGAYDVSVQFAITTESDLYPGPGYMALALLAYNDYYFNLPLDDIFNAPYASRIPALLDGTRKENDVHSQLPGRLSALLNPSFLQSFRSNPESTFNRALKLNDLANFQVKAPTRFIHGKRDRIVPYPVAEKAYNSLLACGTDQDILELYAFDGDHDYGVYLRLAFEWFQTLQ
jgi:pimeloyl-ACP methyl ester carboxylesterase